MSTSDILDEAFNIYKADVGTVVLIAATFIVPLELLVAYLQRNVLGGRGIVDFINNSANQTSGTSTGQIVGSYGGRLLQGVVLILIAAALSRIVSAAYHGKRGKAGEALGFALRRSWVVLIAFVLVHIPEWIAFGLCLFPGICWMTMFVAVGPAIGVEGLGPWASLRRSWGLVRTRFWPTMGVALLTALLATVLGFVLAVPFSIPAALIGYRRAWVLSGLGGIVSMLVVQPFVALVATLVYFDLRMRKEGFDLELAVEALTRGEA